MPLRINVTLLLRVTSHRALLNAGRHPASFSGGLGIALLELDACMMEDSRISHHIPFAETFVGMQLASRWRQCYQLQDLFVSIVMRNQSQKWTGYIIKAFRLPTDPSPRHIGKCHIGCDDRP